VFIVIATSTPKFSHIIPVRRSSDLLGINECIDYKLLSFLSEVCSATKPIQCLYLATLSFPVILVCSIANLYGQMLN